MRAQGKEKKGIKTVLVTAFEPFGGEAINPTETILEKLPDTIRGFEIVKLLLPVEFIRAGEIAFAEYDRIRPAAVIMLGQAGGRDAITPETTAKNVMTARIPDNSGYKPDGVPVSAGGPDVLYSTLPVGRIVEALAALGVPCHASDDAGEYVCNCLFYSMLDRSKEEVPTGFIHVPYLKEQGHEDKPFMEEYDMYRGVAAAVETVIKE